MEQLNRKQTVLFSDIAGSSRLYAVLGNQKAEQKIRFVVDTMASCAEKYNGKVIKTIGDEIMCSFASLRAATDSAKEMNRFVQEVGVDLRTGMSSGDVIERDNDLFGDVVNNAAFLTKLARPKEILIDENALSSEENTIIHEVDLIAEMTIKGQNDPCKIYRVNWENLSQKTQGATLINGLPATNKKGQTLKLELEGRQFVVDQSQPVIVVGRDRKSASLKVVHAKVSRRHCTLKYKQGKFILEDHSTNGTFVEQTGLSDAFVHRESFALLGNGVLKPGDRNLPESFQLTYSVSDGAEP